MRLLAIIPTLKKTKPYLDLCVKSLKENSVNEYEILIAENGEGTKFPQGQCKAINRVLKGKKANWIFLINDDMYFPKNWDKNIDFTISDCFSPNLVEPLEQESAPPFLKLDAGNSLDNFKKDAVDEFVENHQDKIIENGFNLPTFIKKELLDKIEGYDENYDPWGSNSDSDLEYQIVLTGVQPKRNRSLLVYHFGSKSGTFDGTHQDYWQKNLLYFKEKWGFDRIGSPQIWDAELDIPMDKLKYRLK